MRCVPSPGCTPTPCHSNTILTISSKHVSHCRNIQNKFRIIRPGSTRIEVGDRVLLRSVYKPSMWLNCSGLNKECKITPCTTNHADPSNSSYISDCEEHFFILEQGKRPRGKVAVVKQEVELRSFRHDSYLNCAGRKCAMVGNGVCPTASPFREHLVDILKNGDGTCDPQSFSVTKLREGTS